MILKNTHTLCERVYIFNCFFPPFLFVVLFSLPIFSPAPSTLKVLVILAAIQGRRGPSPESGQPLVFVSRHLLRCGSKDPSLPGGTTGQGLPLGAG